VEVDGPSGATHYTYSGSRGPLTKITVPDGTAISLAYDAAGRVHTVTTPAGTSTFNYYDGYTTVDSPGGAHAYAYDTGLNLLAV
jgi:YD repeat-containing protein